MAHYDSYFVRYTSQMLDKLEQHAKSACNRVVQDIKSKAGLYVNLSLHEKDMFTHTIAQNPKLDHHQLGCEMVMSRQTSGHLIQFDW